MPKTVCDTSSCFLCQCCLPEWGKLTALRKETRLYKKGERIFLEGEPANGMYFTLSGAVKVHRQWDEGKELVIRFVSGDDILGVRGFGETVFRVSATALEASRICFIPTEHVQASLQANPDFSYKLMLFYAAELQKAEQRMSDLAQLDVKGRIASTLLLLKETFGNDSDGFIGVGVSRQDIASYSGTIYETVFKVFAEWSQAGIIHTEGKRMKVLNEKKLRTQIR